MDHGESCCLNLSTSLLYFRHCFPSENFSKYFPQPGFEPWISCSRSENFNHCTTLRSNNLSVASDQKKKSHHSGFVLVFQSSHVHSNKPFQSAEAPPNAPWDDMILSCEWKYRTKTCRYLALPIFHTLNYNTVMCVDLVLFQHM